MKQIAQYIRKYFYELDKKHFVLTSVLVGGLIFLNYFFELDKMINRQDSFLVSIFSRWLIFLIAFILLTFSFPVSRGARSPSEIFTDIYQPGRYHLAAFWG